MSNDINNPDDSQLDVRISASKDNLSLKAKGAGILVLIALSIAGIVILGYQMKAEFSYIFLPIIILGTITYKLIDSAIDLLGIKQKQPKKED